MSDKTKVIARDSAPQEATLVQDKTVVQSRLAPPTISKKPARDSVTVGDCLKARFDLLEVLGVGGMGVVYRARDRRQKELGEKEPYLALKVLSDTLQGNDAALIALQQECKKTQRLSHPNIVNVYDFDRDDRTVFMTMELLHGYSLDELIYKDGFKGKPFAEIVPWITAIGEALQFAHDNGIIHSDFKPSNIFITEQGTIKIFDFGIARAMQEAEEHSARKQLSAMTPAFASLGMLTDQSPQPSDDLYAFAVVVYFLLAGSHPYQRKNALQVKQQKLAPIRPPGLADDVWKVLRQALDPVGCESLTVQAFIDGLLPRPPKLTRSMGLLLATLGAVITLSVGVWGVGTYQDHQIIDALSSGDDAVIQQAMETLDRIEPHRARDILTASRDSLVAYGINKANTLKSEGKLWQASGYCERLLEKFPDSRKLWSLQGSLKKAIGTRAAELEASLTIRQTQLLGMSDSGVNEWLEDLSKLKETQPTHPMLSVSTLERQLKAVVHSQLFMGQIGNANKIITWAEDNGLSNQKLSPLMGLIDRYKRTQLQKGSAQVHSSMVPNVAPLIRLENHPVHASLADGGVEVEEVLQLITAVAGQDAEVGEALWWALKGHFNDNQKSNKEYQRWHRALISERP